MTCLQCQEPIEAHWHFCRWCGNALPTTAPTVHQNNMLDNFLAALVAHNAAQRNMQGSDGSGHRFDNIDDAIAWAKYH